MKWGKKKLNHNLKVLFKYIEYFFSGEFISLGMF